MSLLFKRDVHYPLDPDAKKTYHSKAYHRFFEGFEEHEVPGDDGKNRIERIYTGAWYSLPLSKTRKILLLLGYVFLFLIACFCYFYACSRRISSNTQWFTILFESISLICLGWVVVSLFNYLTRPPKMTIYEFKSTSKSLRRSSLFATIGLLITWLISSVYSIAIGTAANMLPAVLFYWPQHAVSPFFSWNVGLNTTRPSLRQRLLPPTPDIKCKKLPLC